MRAFGANTDDDLAAELRRKYGLRVRQSTVWRWRHGETTPGYEATLVMLEECGWLRLDAEMLPISEPATNLDARLDAIAASLAVLHGNQEAALDALGVSEADRVRPAIDTSPPEAPPTQTASQP